MFGRAAVFENGCVTTGATRLCALVMAGEPSPCTVLTKVSAHSKAKSAARAPTHVAETPGKPPEGMHKRGRARPPTEPLPPPPPPPQRHRRHHRATADPESAQCRSKTGAESTLSRPQVDPRSTPHPPQRPTQGRVHKPTPERSLTRTPCGEPRSGPRFGQGRPPIDPRSALPRTVLFRTPGASQKTVKRTFWG